jgi:hypothetical protein
MEKFPQRTYNMTDTELAQFVSNLCVFLTRDLTDLAKYGISAPKIEALQALQNDFEVYPTDVQLIYSVASATENKDAQREVIMNILSDIRVRASFALGEDSSHYKEFGFTDFAHESDTAFLGASRMIALTARKYLTELTGKGQTEDEIDDLIAECDTLEILLSTKKSAEGYRTESTRERTNKGNEMYGIASEYSSYGRTCYMNTNSAKYQEYVIYGSVSPTSVHGAPSGIHFESGNTLAWTAIDNATSYGVSLSDDGGTNWQTDITTSTNSTVVPVIAFGKLYYRVRGRNSTGYGEYSGTFEYLFGLESVDNFTNDGHEFSWDSVQFANGYDIERTITGEGSWVLIFNSGGTSMSDNPGAGNWTYRIRASNGTVKGDWTELGVSFS